MSGGTKKPDLNRETVRVICDYSYKPDNSSETISLKVGDEYQLIKKVNSDWWYVRKGGQSLPSFYIPAKYVEVVPKAKSDTETGAKSPVIGGGDIKSLNVAAGGKSLEPTSSAVVPPTTRTVPPPKPKPRVSKSASEDEALKVLDAAIDEIEVKSDETKKLPSVSEMRLDRKTSQPLPDKEKTKVDESVKSPRISVESVKPSVESVKPPKVESVKPPSAESVKPPSVESVKPLSVESVKPPSVESVKSPKVESVKPLSVESVKPPSVESVKSPKVESVKPLSVESVKSPKVESVQPPKVETVKPTNAESIVKLPHPPIPNIPSPAASSGSPASTGLPTPSSSSGLSTLPAPSSSSAPPSTLTPPISPIEDEINYVNLDEYQQMVKDRITQTTVSKENLIDSETTDIMTVVSDNPAESETSDYRSGDSKGGSRESLDSDSQGKSCDTDSIGTKEDLEKVDQVAANTEDSVGKTKTELVLQPKPAVIRGPRVVVNTGVSDYANLEDIRKSSIHPQKARQSVATNGKTPVGGLPAIEVPSGWTVEVEDGVSTFVNTAVGEKWTSAVDKDGRNYFYNLSTHATVWNLADVSMSISSSALRRISSSATDPVATSGKGKDRRTLATSSELDKKRGAWPSAGLLRNAGLLRLAFSGKDGKVLEGGIAEAEPNLSEAAAEFPALEPLPIKMVQKQGPLGKAKAELGKKSKKPAWSQSYAVLFENGLFFFKDQKLSAGAKPKSVNSLGKPDVILDLTDAQLSSSPDEKKNLILVLTLSKGDVYLLHNESEDVLQHWKESLENNITVLVTTPVKDVKDLSITTPTKAVEMSRLSSYIGVLGEDRLHIADKLLHWLKRRPTKESLQAKGILKEAVFGSSLTELCEREKTKIPRFVHECIVAVEKRGLDVEGVYRVGGNMANVQKLRQMADNNEYYELNSSFWDIHVVTGALKLFFRELSEPLFTFALFEEFLNAYKVQGRTSQVKAIREIIRKLPTVHKETMKELFKHLTDVIRHTSSNRMHTQALAIVFGPTLLWPEAKNKDMNLAASMVYQGQVVEFMIIEFKAIFS